MSKKNVMIDLETLGKGSNSVISSIGAVEFDLTTGKHGRTFYQAISIQSSLDAGLKVDGSSLEFWLKQGDSARLALLKDTKTLGESLYLLRKFIESLGVDSLMVWGNGTRFDLGLLHDAYRAVKNQVIPWQFRNERDVRTYIADHLYVKDQMVFKGTEHNALDDCCHQIAYMYQVHKIKNPNLLIEERALCDNNNDNNVPSFSQETIERKIESLIKSKFDYNNLEYSKDMLLRSDLGIDFMDKFDLIIDLENIFHIAIEDHLVDALESIQDVIDCVIKHKEIKIL